MSASVWIDVKKHRAEEIWNHTVSVVREGASVRVELRGIGRSGSDDRYQPNHRVNAGIVLPISDALRLAHALLIAASSEDRIGDMTFNLKPNSTGKVHGLVTKRLVGETLALQKVSGIVFSGTEEASATD
jgi:hypothetical protein